MCIRDRYKDEDKESPTFGELLPTFCRNNDDLYLVEFNILPPTNIELSLHKDWLDNYGNELMKNQYFKYENVDFEEIAKANRD